SAVFQKHQEHSQCLLAVTPMKNTPEPVLANAAAGCLTQTSSQSSLFSGRNARLRPRQQVGYFLQSGSPCAARGRHNENGIVCGITTRGSMTLPTLRSQFREE